MNEAFALIDGGNHSAAGAQLLGEAQVCEDDVALPVQEDVLRLEVPVDDVEAVQVTEGGRDLGQVEGGGVQGEPGVAPKVGEELAPRHVGAEEVEVVSVPGPPGEGGHQRVRHTAQQPLLAPEVLHLLQGDDLPQRQDLHRVVSLAWLVQAQTHFAKCSSAHCFYQAKLV